MSWVAAAGTAVAVGGSILSSNAAKKAAKQQRKAARAAQQVQTTQHDASTAALDPYRTFGAQSMNALSAGIGDGQNGFLTKQFTGDNLASDPGYQFRLQQGTQTTQAGAAARGGVLSGAAQKALAQYGQGFASNEFGAAYSRDAADKTRNYNMLSNGVNTGLNATNTQVGANTDYGNQVGNLITGAGNAQAAGTVASSNALMGGLNAIGNGAQGYAAMQNQNNQNALNRQAFGGTYGNLAASSFNNSANYG
jgi:hypothetical protein